MIASGSLDLADADAAGQLGMALASTLRVGDVVTLAGPLGAGKTTLARGILAGLGLADEAPSPSFPLVIAYAPPELAIPVWHVDLYRVDDAEELDELGLDDARLEAALLVEWPERMGARAWPDALRLSLEEEPAGGRRLTWQASGSWEGRWPPVRS
ncbi:tRNA (adenosine(37)-N6)-threonylcarbamoyltransferase complex ATPase subunit type 1 TsaE [uncultured Sphingomonas sp.]|uniref:tRNA (adenosine(37)-N6)-threonylcarbamoyltransferase complex ATPase subunit type 1 TsaE n=1 Tax=uncultured Sphingomonas sp. TaxID=158754 RepID=UPI0025DB8D19|nr:tRNA (adenosine(37)-N6)-threonylcarbamoyltransferase complex ATPase subunit type 1 TsaE [uncultured Sphingomonas sp.]